MYWTSACSFVGGVIHVFLLEPIPDVALEDVKLEQNGEGEDADGCVCVEETEVRRLTRGAGRTGSAQWPSSS